jgi:predicted dehydrogenase/nucleoside-diphosphate-sugar epimerase
MSPPTSEATLRPAGRPSKHILVLGGGALAAELYAPAVVRLGWEREMLFVDVSPRSIEVLQSAFPSLRTRVGGYAGLIHDRDFISQFEGVVIALPNYLHEHAVTACLEAGLDVLCEKPLALDARTCRQLGDVAEKTGRRLSIAMVRRLIPAVLAVKDALRTGLIGDVSHLEIQHGSSFQWPSESGAYFRPENGGLLVNMGVHYLDMIEDWVGPLLPVAYRDDFGGGAEANCDYTLRTTAGGAVRLKLSVTDRLANCVVIRGSRGEIRIDVNKFDSFSWIGYESGLIGDLRPQRPFSSETWPLDFVSSFAQQFFEFREVIERNAPVRVSARQAERTHELIDWAYAHRDSLLPRIERSGLRPELTPAKATVTGGSGFVGEKLVERLHQLGFDNIVVPVRSYRSGAGVARFAVERRLTDLLNYESVLQSVAGSRYVFHLAYGSGGNDSARVTVEGTKNVVEAAIAQQAEAVVVVSTATVFGHPGGDRPIDETFPYRPALGEYGNSKTQAEKYCLARAKTSGRTRIVVINPGSIYGPGGRLFTELPVRALQEGYFSWIDGGIGKINYAFVDNVVDALILAANCASAHGQNFIVCDGVSTFREFLTPLLGSLAEKVPSCTRQQILQMEKAARPGFRDLLSALTGPEIMRVVNGLPLLSTPKKLIENRFRKTYAKAQVARATLRFQTNEANRGSAKGVPPLWLADIFGSFATEYSSRKAREILGWTPLVSLEEGVRASRHWLGTLGLPSRDRSGSPEAADEEFSTLAGH